jgi:hypothetical protein
MHISIYSGRVNRYTLQKYLHVFWVTRWSYCISRLRRKNGDAACYPSCQSLVGRASNTTEASAPPKHDPLIVKGTRSLMVYYMIAASTALHISHSTTWYLLQLSTPCNKSEPTHVLSHTITAYYWDMRMVCLAGCCLYLWKRSLRNGQAKIKLRYLDRSTCPFLTTCNFPVGFIWFMSFKTW